MGLKISKKSTFLGQLNRLIPGKPLEPRIQKKFRILLAHWQLPWAHSSRIEKKIHAGKISFRMMDSFLYETIAALVTRRMVTLKKTSGLTVKSALRSALHNRWPHCCCSCCENGQVKFWLTPSALLMFCMTSKKQAYEKLVRKKSQVIVKYCGTTYVEVQGTIL